MCKADDKPPLLARMLVLCVLVLAAWFALFVAADILYRIVVLIGG